MDNKTIRVVVGLRLGTTIICEPHRPTCRCGTMMTANGSNGLSCGLGTGRIARHATINDIISRGLTQAGMPNIKKPPGLSRTDGKRPDGLTLIPWRGGRRLVWDGTIIDTIAPSYAPKAVAGAAVELAATRKITNYDHLLDSHQFVPIAFETLGLINNSGIDFIKDLGKRLTLNTGDIR